MNGIIIINKPKNYTSHDIVYKIKKASGEKVGHTGTLDPLATGVLPLLVGKGTLCSKYLINHDKKYKVILSLGKKTDTADKEGKVIEEKEVPDEIWEKDNIENVLQKMIGKQKQIPPIYSAIKVKGKKLYEYARKNEIVKVEPRNIEIYDINLDSKIKDKSQISFTVSCSKGTYIRSLCEDIANLLDTVGYMEELERIEVGNFKIENSINVDEIENSKDKKEFIKKHLITIETIFENNQSIYLNSKELQHFLNGVKLTKDLTDGIYRIYYENKFIGIGICNQKSLKRDIVI